jgi:predicted NUDIX family phosphoesterase
MAANEEVLVAERKVLEQAGMFQGLMFDMQRYLELLFKPGVLRFMPRAEAETNPAFKQLIPYVLMTCGGKYLTYVRGKRAGETRLVGHRSIGIGGHINPVDEMPLFGDLREAYMAAVEREVAEEVAVETAHTDRFVAFLNDDSTPVGQVHLGVVHLWVLEEPKVNRREQMITQMGFMSPEELMRERDTMETWSQLCLDKISQITKNK